MKGRRVVLLLGAVAVAVCCVLLLQVDVVVQVMTGQKTVEDRLEEFGEAARGRMSGDFERVGVGYPPERVVLAGFKEERRLEVWVAAASGPFKLLKSYPILGASGRLGPKLEEGDLQVPEGLYRIESLHPNSSFHVALRVNYPNEFDKIKARTDNRSRLGSDIMIHGSSASVGCLAMGDQAAEELFALAADVGLDNVSLILSPVDFRTATLLPDAPAPEWVAELYEILEQELRRLGE